MAKELRQTFKKGTILMREGDPGDRAYVIESGSVEVLMTKENSLMQIGMRGPGSIIGEMAMIDDKPRTATIRALEDCAVLCISRDDFSRRMDDADPVLRMVMHVVMTRYRDLAGRTQMIKFPHAGNTAEAHENTHEMHDIAVGNIKIHNELQDAIRKNQLVLFYQPIIDLQKMKIAGFEALMRWKHPEKGMISPGVFIPVAEESGLINEMTPWALGTACDAAKDLDAAVAPQLRAGGPLFVSVNFSVKDFSAGDAFQRISSIIKEKNISPGHIHLEITESLLMEAPGEAKAALQSCRDMGLGVSIDDFGSGYSSLSYLHHFPINILKIDQSFIRAMSTHESSLVLVKSIIGLARNLNMKVIAEGIETPQEARIVRDLGCEQGQGYLFARPLPLEEAKALAQGWNVPEI